ncbi:Fic family protein [Actinacidiphila guanduensis]|uniref:Fic family protein n=1 Tax=Actinacidiphila guanduensis TaxID=310781 RepID=A0A1H0DWI8_9ACTN|nr:Fic family protein [Actinacidiphila guanduensis]SDN74564.1 Fic family protein [Actinacidiphila guanduensis]
MNVSSSAPELYTVPRLTSEDQSVLGEIHQMRKDMRMVLRTPRRWEGGLRRSVLAKAVQGSNSIEGYEVAEDDALAALDDEEPMSADEKTFAEIKGYQQTMGYVLAIGSDSLATYDTSELRAMHFMMLQHEPSKSPGHFRKGPIYVHNHETERQVYEGPDHEAVPELMNALVRSLRTGHEHDPVVRSAMAHLNLVMIHPFRDGNGRMARALATLVLARSDIGEPVFSSIEEWLGAKSNTLDYYAALGHTGRGVWAPRADAQLWLSFCLRAHHMQAQTMARRVEDADRYWLHLDGIVSSHKLPERVLDPLFDAVLGYRIRRGGYMKRAGIEGQTATRDLAHLAGLGLLAAHGSGRGRHYTAAGPLLEVRADVRSRRGAVTDPYPGMRSELAKPIAWEK